MAANTTKTAAEKYLKLFNHDLEEAIEQLRQISAHKRSQKKPKISANAPVVVEVKDVFKTYKLGGEKVNALNGVSLNVQQGEFISITGESGSGKSTLLQLIGGLDKPSSGEIIVDGHNLGKLRDHRLSVFRNKTVGFVFQFFYLQPFLNTQLNLQVPGMFARTPKTKRVEASQELAEAVGLSDRLKHLPKELSGGQMQRAAIARALLNRPKILLADEPTGNLDRANGAAIIELFEQIRSKYGTTVIIVTHDRNIAAQTDREIVLRDGKIQN